MDAGLFSYGPEAQGRLIHTDHLGTPQKMTDSSGTVVWSADYKPFGEATITVSTITNNLKFPGQYYDAETGLNYNLNRDYNQVIGRYIESDPLSFPFVYRGRSYFVPPYFTKTPSKLHDYLYAANDPVNLMDSSGLQVSGGTGACQPDTCQAQADAAYNDCMTRMRQGPQRMATTTCVILAIGAGVGAGVATQNPIIGGIIGTGLTIVCFTVPSGIEDPGLRTGEAYCGMLRQRFYETCEAAR